MSQPASQSATVRYGQPVSASPGEAAGTFCATSIAVPTPPTAGTGAGVDDEVAVTGVPAALDVDVMGLLLGAAAVVVDFVLHGVLGVGPVSDGEGFGRQLPAAD